MNKKLKTIWSKFIFNFSSKYRIAKFFTIILSFLLLILYIIDAILKYKSGILLSNVIVTSGSSICIAVILIIGLINIYRYLFVVLFAIIDNQMMLLFKNEKDRNIKGVIVKILAEKQRKDMKIEDGRMIRVEGVDIINKFIEKYSGKNDDFYSIFCNFEVQPSEMVYKFLDDNKEFIKNNSVIVDNEEVKSMKIKIVGIVCKLFWIMGKNDLKVKYVKDGVV